ncbi:helix-turn-helix transcriptional regulator [Bacillaceae bacterium SIJ1]|uniref:helix-turn-helix domain-containing protein n=1 Tax=Litoribacterium kuwaitense TaxID=1398745 RepID=UPI0013EA42F2|nr:helix-turn-helix transcriptional regulator [Litoribacterium kuwaitense]NGP46013.1 helix-turn-helix transcriptional regulator [Litoribacterium kuwaitense]
MSVGKVLQSTRKDHKESQEQLSFDLGLSREALSSYETERAKLPADIGQALTKRYGDPFIALTAVSKYLGYGVGKLDGSAVDLHRMSVKSKTEEELEEVLVAIQKLQMTNHPSHAVAHERQRMEEALQEACDAIVALKHFIAICCKEYGFNWLSVWSRHKAKLIANKYIKKGE